MRILVAGGAGFIGSDFVRLLFNQTNHNIVIVDKLTYASDLRNIEDILASERIQFFQGDIRDFGFMYDIITNVDYIINFAAETHVARSIFTTLNFAETDFMGTQVICDCLVRNRHIKRFIHVSTSEVYGTALTEYMHEDHQLNPRSPYAAAKAAADRLVYSYIKTYNIPALIVRPFNNYGIRQHPEKLIPRFITNSILGRESLIHGDGNALRDWVSVRDTSSAILLLLTYEDIDGEVFNIGTGRSLSIKYIAKRIEGKYRYVEDRPGQVSRHTAHVGKLWKLGWQPSYSFDDHLKVIFDWYSKNKEWWIDKIEYANVPIKNGNGTGLIYR